MTYYVIDKRTGKIVNAIETDSLRRAQEALIGFDNRHHLEVTPSPLLETLEQYRYWRERP
jgi:hypothetical protein